MTSKKKSRQVTMKDVAAAAGVSTMSVSNVVNERWDLVSERTRVIIVNEIKRLKYQPQHAGRSLRTGKTNTIGLLILQEKTVSTRLRRRYQSVLSGFMEAIAAHGYSVYPMFDSHSSLARAVGNIAQKLDGLALMIEDTIALNPKDLSALEELAIPIIEIHSLRLIGLTDICSVHESVDGPINDLATVISRLAPGCILRVAAEPERNLAGRRFNLLKSNAHMKHFRFQPEMSVQLMTKWLSSRENARTLAAIIVDSEQDALRLFRMCPSDMLPGVLDRVYCLDLQESPSREPEFSVVPGIVSAAYRVGNVAGNTLIARLSINAFPHRDITVDSSLICYKHDGIARSKTVG